MTFETWTKNPFSTKVYPDIIIGRDEELDKIGRYIKDSGSWFSAVISQFGAGKTTLLRNVQKSEEGVGHHVIFFQTPPTKVDFVKVVGDAFSTWWDNLRKKAPTTAEELPEYVGGRLKGRLTFLIDDAQESNENSAWNNIKQLMTSDKVGDIACVFASSDKGFENVPEHIIQRINSKIILDPFDKVEDAKMLVHERIQRIAEAEDPSPFTDDAVESIWKASHRTPTSILNICDRLYVLCKEEGRESISTTEISKVLKEIERPKAEESTPTPQEKPVEATKVVKKEKDTLHADITRALYERLLPDSQIKILDSLVELGPSPLPAIQQGTGLSKGSASALLVRMVGEKNEKQRHPDVVYPLITKKKERVDGRMRTVYSAASHVQRGWRAR